jgi:hypothetical protein
MNSLEKKDYYLSHKDKIVSYRKYLSKKEKLKKEMIKLIHLYKSIDNEINMSLIEPDDQVHKICKLLI